MKTGNESSITGFYSKGADTFLINNYIRAEGQMIMIDEQKSNDKIFVDMSEGCYARWCRKLYSLVRVIRKSQWSNTARSTFTGMLFGVTGI